MQTVTVVYIFIAFIISVLVAYYQYFFKSKKKYKANTWLFALKLCGIFLLLLLFINPKINSTTYQNIKPTLTILVDDSESIKFFNEHNNVRGVLNNLNSNKSFSDKFIIKEFSFGKSLTTFDSLSFDKTNTDIFSAIETVKKINNKSPIIILTDGNQTIGNDYEFLNSAGKIYPIVFGDTTSSQDLKITQVNANKFSYLNNKFPVEVILNYEGKESTKTTFSIFKNDKKIYSKKVAFNKEKKSDIITINIDAEKEGMNYFTASLQEIKNEKNKSNNKKTFAVEVLSKQSEILILTSILHPDLGALKKAIESNKQRTVKVVAIEEFNNQINDFQLIILYQPTEKFKNVLNSITKQNINFLLISGTQTNWNFINNQQLGFAKNATNLIEDFEIEFNPNFLPFLQNNIGFEQFPPLKDLFGEITFMKNHHNLFFQKINNLKTTQPLFSIFEENEIKKGVLFGEGIWKWRAHSFLNSNSFEEFDQFLGNAIQYLSSSIKRKRLELSAENVYPSNTKISISAFYMDENYLFDDRASLEITIKNTLTNSVIKLPFSLINNSYQVLIDNLPPGDYSFVVTVLGQKLNQKGYFKILDYKIEEQYTNSNYKKLQILANKTGGKLYYKNQINELIDSLLNDTSYYITQKEVKKSKNLLDWEWILFLILALFTTEWFIRKYNGKI